MPMWKKGLTPAQLTSFPAAYWRALETEGQVTIRCSLGTLDEAQRERKRFSAFKHAVKHCPGSRLHRNVFDFVTRTQIIHASDGYMVVVTTRLGEAATLLAQVPDLLQQT